MKLDWTSYYGASRQGQFVGALFNDNTRNRRTVDWLHDMAERDGVEITALNSRAEYDDWRKSLIA